LASHHKSRRPGRRLAQRPAPHPLW
jgi:hypothetical protein